MCQGDRSHAVSVIESLQKEDFIDPRMNGKDIECFDDSQCSSTSPVSYNDVGSLGSPTCSNQYSESEVVVDRAFYKRPDPYDGLVTQVRTTLLERESEMKEAAKLMEVLKRRAELSCPNVASMLQSPDLSAINSFLNGSMTGNASSVFLPSKSLKEATCHVCRLTFASVQSMVRHVKRLHPSEIDNVNVHYGKCSMPFQCDVCKKSFGGQEALATHKRRHDVDRRRFDCARCSKTYILPSELRKHMKRVHGVETNFIPTIRNPSEDMPDI